MLSWPVGDDSITLGAVQHRTSAVPADWVLPRLKCVRQAECLSACRAFGFFPLPPQQQPPTPEHEAGDPEH
jgi:hypothetical protein